LATAAAKGAFYRKWRLVSMDGTAIDAADTPANAEVVGRAGAGRGDGSAFPQLCAIDDPGRPGATDTKHRLITTILDPTAAPAGELAALYAERWEIESIFHEFKTHQRGPRVVLRSGTPEGVYQEARGYLCVHYALRALIHAAVHDYDLDPDRISFTTALYAARRSIRTGLRETVNLTGALRRATSELVHGLLPKRRLGANARVGRRKVSNYDVKRGHHHDWPVPSIRIGSAVSVLSQS